MAPPPPRATRRPHADPHWANRIIDPAGPDVSVPDLDVGDLVDLPIDVLAYRAMIGDLDPGVPLALLPVRLETRYTRERGFDELLVRVYPDVVHADDHQEQLTAEEHRLGRAFWRRTWRAGGVVEELDAAFAWLSEHVGPWRAAWIARTTTPRNAEEAPGEPVGEDEPLLPRPRFPDLEERTETRAPYARLLPLRWVVVGYWPSEPVGTWYSEVVAEPLAVAPTLADVQPGDGADGVDARGLLDSQGLQWTHDAQAAEDAGMLVRIDLRTTPGPTFTELIVFGVRQDAEVSDLASLLAAHRYTHGLDLIGQGTPTNTTATAAAPWHPHRPDLSALRERELRTATPDERPAVAEDGDLLRMAGADAVSVALGLGVDNAVDRAPHASLTELPDAEGMNRALWPALFGHWFRSIMGNVVTGANRTWLRDWATTFVRGGGPLPTLLVGEQPYGLLPASRVAPSDDAGSAIAMIETFLETISSHWASGVDDVDRLDPGLSDAPPGDETDGDLAAVVSRVLGGIPHPGAFRLRGVDAMRDDYNETFGGLQWRIGFDALLFPDKTGAPIGSADGNWAYRVYETMVDELGEAQTLGMQIDALESAAFSYNRATGVADDDGTTTLFTDPQKEHIRAMGADIDDHIPMLEAHGSRAAPVMSFVYLHDPASSVTGMMGDGDDPHAFFAFHDDEGEEVTWSAALVADAESTPDDTAAWMTELRERAAGGTGSTGDFGQVRPLLQHLIDRSVGQCLDDGDDGTVTAGLDRLLEIVTDDPAWRETLERLLRETVGTATHRLDAWYTGVASWRLDNKRSRRPRGLHIGAWGAVVDLRPRDARPSQGHVLAPSLSHATTAAVLRSGWSAFGGAEQTSGLAVDLSSDRMRRAAWIVDGVRRGQDLGELLGARFERRLHDAALDRWLRPFRELVLFSAGEDIPPNAVVDGLFLARAHGGGPNLTAAERSLADALPDWLASSDRPPGDPGVALDELVNDLDAAADATAAQGVFALVEGNLPEANATLTAAGSGEVDFPALRVLDSPAGSATVQHRLVVMVDPDAESSWAGATTSGRALAAPGLEAWIASLLPDPARVRFNVAFDGADEVVPASLDDVALSSLDLLFLTPAGDDAGLGRLEGVLAAWAERHRPVAADPSTPGRIDDAVGDPSLRDLVVVARALRALVTSARDLDDAALGDPAAGERASGVDLDALGDRVAAVRSVLGQLGAALSAAIGDDVEQAEVAALRDAMVALSGYHFDGNASAVLDDADVRAGAKRLDEAVTRRLEEADALLAVDDATSSSDPEDGTITDADRRSALEDALALLVGHAMPWAPRFRTADETALTTNLQRRRLTQAEVATGWLATAGRVDPGAQRLRVAVDLVEALTDDRRFPFGVVQWPDNTGETWAAVDGSLADGRGRTSLLVTGALPRAAGDLAGVVVGSWTEALPGDRETPGLIFHFDAPSAQAPQAIILCLATPGDGFSVEFIRDTIFQCLDLARMRMVGLDVLDGLGQYLPAAYLPDDLTAGAPS